MSESAIAKKSFGRPMTEEEFIRELKGSLVILNTSSPDKRIIFNQLFSLLDKDAEGFAGLDLHFIDSGSLGIVPTKTPEKTSTFRGNLDEKAQQFLRTLQDSRLQSDIRQKLGGISDDSPQSQNSFNPHTINIMGMVEDSGWELEFSTKTIKKKFTDSVLAKLKNGRLREYKDDWLVDKIDKRFPGPNLKPIQEHLEGGFHELMEIIYATAAELKIDNLRYINTTHVSFVSPATGKHFEKEFKARGSIIPHDEYEKRLIDTKKGEAINSDFVHIPDGQAKGEQKSFSEMIDIPGVEEEEAKSIYTTSSKMLPAEYTRRALTEYLQGLLGKRQSLPNEISRNIKIAYVTPDDKTGDPSNDQNPGIYVKNSIATDIPTHSELMEYPNKPLMGEAQVVVLIPKKQKINDSNLYTDPNQRMLSEFGVSAQTDAKSMGVPIVLDNRSGAFSNALKAMTLSFVEGRMIGNTPCYIANTNDELTKTLSKIRDVKQRSPIIATPDKETEEVPAPLPEKIPNDGIFTVFIAGGHANNAKRDIEEAQQLGYLCASNGWRIVTGAGAIEGSMGAVHTGFIQYHLDHLNNAAITFSDTKRAEFNELKGELLPYFNTKTRKYDTEKLIDENPHLVNRLADDGYIPRDMFYGYSMQSLLELESPLKSPPPGIRYFDAGNRIRRIDALIAPGTKLFLPGSIGSDEELEATIKQHLDARMRGEKAANDSFFADGTPDKDGTIIIYNRNGILSRLLRNYGLDGDDPIVQIKRKLYNIIVVDSLESSKSALTNRANTWLDRVSSVDTSKHERGTG